MPFLIVNKHLLRDLYGAPCHSCKWLVRIAMVDLYGAHCRSMKMGYFVEFTPNNSRAAIHKLSMILYWYVHITYTYGYEVKASEIPFKITYRQRRPPFWLPVQVLVRSAVHRRWMCTRSTVPLFKATTLYQQLYGIVNGKKHWLRLTENGYLTWDRIERARVQNSIFLYKTVYCSNTVCCIGMCNTRIESGDPQLSFDTKHMAFRKK